MTILRRLILLLAVLACCQKPSAQTIYDPVLDPTAQVESQSAGETWQTSYMWYPGQLAAYRQQWLRGQSQARCVNVGYPGKFNPTAEVTFFRQEMRLRQPVTLRWKAVDAANVSIDLDGETQPTGGTLAIGQGKHTILLKVETEGKLPALMVEGLPQQGWNVSLDGEHWTMAETDSRYNRPDISPNSRIDQRVTLIPKKQTPIKNAEDNTLGRNGSILYDFFYNEPGVVEISAEGTGRLHFTVGESVEEVMNEDVNLFEQRPIDDVELTDNPQTYLLPERALRYLKVTATHEARIIDVKFHAWMWPVSFDFQFECSDGGLNDLVNAGVATLHTSMHDFSLDGVKRDFLPWAMDEVVSMLGMNLAFADRQVARNNLSIALMPPSPKTEDWGIVDYPLHALIGLKQDYLRYGDLSTVQMYKDRIFAQLDFYMGQQDERGFIRATKTTSGFIPGWSRDNGPDDYGTACYPQIMLYENFRIGSYFSRLLGDRSKADTYRRQAENLRESIIQHFWDEQRSAFVNGYRADGSKDERISHHAQYWAVLTDLYPSSHYDQLFDSVIPSIPNYKENISYEKGYEALAYIKAGRLQQFRQLLNEVWGDWLAQGYTRFPENFSVAGDVAKQLSFYGRPFGLSLCHGANGVPPIVFAAYGILGFSQSDSQLNHYTFTPNLLDLTYANGRIPVKEGYITLRITSDSIEVEIPDGCTVDIVTSQGLHKLKRAGQYTFQR